VAGAGDEIDSDGPMPRGAQRGGHIALAAAEVENCKSPSAAEALRRWPEKLEAGPAEHGRPVVRAMAADSISPHHLLLVDPRREHEPAAAAFDEVEPADRRERPAAACAHAAVLRRLRCVGSGSLPFRDS
jgi:hypothetical protein